MLHERFSRRLFVKGLSAVGIGGIAGRRSRVNAAGTAKKPAIKNYRETMSYREVGTTGIHASAFSIGTTTADLDVINKGLEMGINLIHTGTSYADGKSIATVAQAIKGKLDRVHLAIKDDFPSIEEAFRILGVDKVDFIMFNNHWVEYFKKKLPDYERQFNEWRERGLVKYAGLTTHGEMSACLDLALSAGFFSCVMPSFTPPQIKELAPQRDKLRQKKISIIAMKTKGELADEKYPAQIASILSDSAVCTVCRTVGSLENLDAWASAAARAKVGFLNRRASARYAQSQRYRGCGMCGKCQKACPMGIAVADAVRCIRYYHDAEASPAVAVREFRAMKLAESLSRCTWCGACDGACPQGIAVMSELTRANRRLGGVACA
jgi:predicted aldo/keto reductase-like oxidoreductase